MHYAELLYSNYYIHKKTRLVMMEELFLQDEREARYKRAEVPLLQIMLETGEGLFV